MKQLLEQSILIKNEDIKYNVSHTLVNASCSLINVFLLQYYQLTPAKHNIFTAHSKLYLFLCPLPEDASCSLLFVNCKSSALATASIILLLLNVAPETVETSMP